MRFGPGPTATRVVAAVAALMAALLTSAASAPAASRPSAPAGPRAPQRWAVIVGINDYAAYDGIDDGDLRGAVNDARSMHEVLTQRWGFPEENTRLLLDADATRAGMEEAVTVWLAERVQPGDVALFFYAGHGSQSLDLEGDEADGLDETIAPQDVTRAASDIDITDDELREWFSRIRTDRMIVIFDSCHSGTATRAVQSRGRSRSLPREQPRVVGTRGEAAAEAMRMDVGGPVMLEFAAAAPEQVAMDWIFIQERGQLEYPGGAFTTHLVRQLWRAQPGTDYRTVFQRAYDALKADRFEQTPQISGNGRTALFDVQPGALPILEPGEVPVPEAPPEVLAVLDGPVAGTPAEASRPSMVRPDFTPPEMVIGGGVASGVTRGSLYALGDGVVRVTEVRPTESVIEPVAGQPSWAAVARLLAWMPPGRTLEVDARSLERSVASQLRVGLEGSDIALSDRDDTDLYLEMKGPDVVLHSRSGAIRASLSAEGPALADSLAGALRQEWAAQRLATLDNPAPGFQLDVTFASDTADFRVGDPIDFRVRSGADGYLTLVDLGPDGTVTVLYPNRFVSDGRVRAGRTLDIPTAEMPFRLRASWPHGWGMVRALVTSAPLDLPSTTEPLLARRDGEVLAAEVGRALRAALEAAWSRPVPLRGALPVEGWATRLLTYRVVP